MEHATLMAFGPFLLRKSIRRSSIFDLWRGERRMDADITPCLVRRLLPPYSLAQETVQAFRSRADQVRAAAIPGAMRYLEQGEADSIPYVAWADVDGWTLQTLIDHHDASNEPMPLGVAVSIIRQVVETLKVAHGLSTPMVHGALRPGSVWLTPQSTVLTGDFEIGHLAEMELTSKEGQEERAWRFMAPERDSNWQDPQPPADVFSCAALLLELFVHGRLSLVEKRLDPMAQIPILADRGVPRPLLHLVVGALSDAPGERPSLVEFAAVLDQAAGELKGASAIATYVAESTPPLEILDPLEKPLTQADDTLIRKIARQKERDQASRVDAVPELMSPKSRPLGHPRAADASSGSRPAVLVLLLLVVAGVFVFRDTLKTWVFGPDSNLALVVVESVPDEALVTYPDGRPIGKTPLEIPLPVPPEGELGVVISKPDFKTVGPVFKPVESGGTVRFSFVLDPLVNGPATAHIRTDPAGARVTVDGVYRGKAPLEVHNLYSGDEHVLVASLKGYQKVRQTFRVEPERPNEVHVALEKAGQTARTTQSSSRTAAGGTKKAAGTAQGTNKSHSQTTATSGRTKVKQGKGYLEVDAIPWATVTVDGVRRGTTETMHRIALSPGVHLLKLEREKKGQVVTRTIIIKEGTVRRMEYDFINEGWRMPSQHPLD